MPQQLPYERLPYRRFELVKIAFEKRLANIPRDPSQDHAPVTVAKQIVGYVDAVLAEMEKKPKTENADAK